MALNNSHPSGCDGTTVTMGGGHAHCSEETGEAAFKKGDSSDIPPTVALGDG